MTQVFKMQRHVLPALCVRRLKPGSEQGSFPLYSKNVLLEFPKHRQLEPFPGRILGLW